MTKTENMVELRVRLPRALVDFLRAAGEDVEKYLCESIMDVVRADLDAGALVDPETLAERLGLKSLS